jgi:hypothetical protein
MGIIAELAEVGHATATWKDGELRLQAVGEVHQSCWSVDLRQSLIDVFPPEFEAIRLRTSPICAEVLTRYVVAETFAVGTRPDEVTLHHAGGRLTVPVEDAAAAGGGAGEGGFDEAEGRSRRRLSFDEAFANAVAALPSRPSQIADWMDVVTVTEIRGEFGGIAGSQDLVVRVRRPHPPS